MGALGAFYTGAAAHEGGVLARGEQPVGVVSYRDLQAGQLATPPESRGRIAGREEVERYRIREGDILIGARGTEPKVAQVPPGYPEAYLSNTLLGFRPRIRAVGDLLTFYLQSPLGQQQLRSLSRGSTIVLSLTASTLQDLPIPLPPRDKQEQIVALHRAFTEWQAADAEIARRRKALMNDIVHLSFNEAE